jgi:hypothetical protein
MCLSKLRQTKHFSADSDPIAMKSLIEVAQHVFDVLRASSEIDMQSLSITSFFANV